MHYELLKFLKHNNMKKIYAFIAGILVAGTAAAQTVNFTQNDKVIDNGSTFEFTAVEIEDFSDYGLGVSYAFDPKIFIQTSADITVDVVAECTTGQNVQLCCGGACASGVTVTKSGIQLTASEPLSTMFEQMGNVQSADNIPTFVSTDLTVYKAGTKNALTSITVVFKYGENGVASVITKDNAFSYANGAISYIVDGSAAAALYTTDGKCVLNTEVSGRGSISTTGIAAGVYIYRLGSKTGKILIKD